MILSRSLLFCALSIAAGACLACRAPRSEQLIDPDVQVALATDVVLARAVSAAPRHDKDGEVDYQFLVLQRLAGPDQQMFSISSSAPGRSRDTTFDHHRDEAFWQRGGGRTMNDTDCVIHPDFVVGKTYLIFRNPPMTWRSFEEVEGDDDQWFRYVQARVRRNRSEMPSIESAFSPEGGAEKLVLKVIDSSVSSIRLAAYSFNSQHIVDALVSARRRGVDIKVIVDQRRNRRKDCIAALNKLVDAGIETRTVSTYALHHDKYIVSDNASVQNGSFNYTKDAATSNSENVIVNWNSAVLAKAFLDHWESRWAQGVKYQK